MPRVIIILLVALVLTACGDAATLVPEPVGLPAAFFETDARNVLRREVRRECNAVGISVSLAKSLRQVELASATRANGHWQFRIEGRTAQVYPSGKVSGDLLPYLNGICRQGN